MVTDEKIYNAALMRYRLGTALIWLGVLVWLPFIVLRIAGEKPSLFLYLPFHLLSVIGGSRLRASARKEIGIETLPKSRLRVFGHGLMLAGILVWVPYFYLKATGQSVDAINYLPYHLIGIFGGLALLAIDYLMLKKR